MANQYLQQLTAVSSVLSGYVIPITDDPAGTGRLKKATVDQFKSWAFGNITLTSVASGATFTLLNGKTFTVNNTLTLSGTDGSTLNIGAGGTLAALAYKSSVDLSSSDATGTIAAARMPAFTGDVTNTAGSLSLGIGSGKVTNLMLAGSITASKLVGTDITTVGTITSGVWNGTAVPIGNGGTGHTTAYAALDALTVQGADIASASTTNLATSTGVYVNITGTTTITAFGTANAGVERICKFAGSLTLTYNATSVILPGGANIVTAAGDIATFVSLGSGNWICTSYQRAVGVPWNGQYVLLSTATANSSASVNFNFTNWTNSDYFAYRLVIANAKPATNNVQAWIRTSADGTNFDSGAGAYTYCNMENSVGTFLTGDTKIPIGGASATSIGSSYSSSGFVDIFNPSAATNCKITSSFNAACSDIYARTNTTAGERLSAAAVKGVQFLFSSGNIASGDFRLYGMRAS